LGGTTHALSNSESLVLEQELILKNALTRTGTPDAQIAAVRIVPTDHIEVPENEQLPPWRTWWPQPSKTVLT
jgi:hypothetical protein